MVVLERLFCIITMYGMQCTNNYIPYIAFNKNNNIYIYISQYPANTACLTRLYTYNIMYKTIIHDDIVYSIKRMLLPLI